MDDRLYFRSNDLDIICTYNTEKQKGTVYHAKIYDCMETDPADGLDQPDDLTLIAELSFRKGKIWKEVDDVQIEIDHRRIQPIAESLAGDVMEAIAQFETAPRV